MNLKSFLEYLKNEKNASDNTVIAYGRDINAFARYMSEKNSSLDKVNKTDILGYLMDMNKKGRSKSTTNRKLASLRAYFDYLMRIGTIKNNPTDDIKTPRAERKDLDYGKDCYR